MNVLSTPTGEFFIRHAGVPDLHIPPAISNECNAQTRRFQLQVFLRSQGVVCEHCIELIADKVDKLKPLLPQWEQMRFSFKK